MALTATPGNRTTHRDPIKCEGQIYGKTLAIEGAAEIDGALTVRGVALAGSPVQGIEFNFTEIATAGTYSASVTVPAGSWLLNCHVHNTVAWTADTSALGKFGDAANDDGYLAAVDHKTLTAALGIDLYWVKTYEGADLTHGTYPDGIRGREYLATERVLSYKIVTVGTTGTAGRTRVVVTWFTPSTSYQTAATFVAT